MATTKENKQALNFNPTLIVGVSNAGEPKILNSSNIAKEPFELQGYKTIGKNKKGEESENADLAYHEGVVNDLIDAGDIMEITNQAVEYKIIHLRRKELDKEKEAVIIYDNVLKKGVVAYSRFEGEKKFQEDKDLVQNGDIILKKPTVSGEELNAAFAVTRAIFDSLRESNKAAYANIVNQLRDAIGDESGKISINGQNVYDFIRIVDENLERDEAILNLYKKLRMEVLEEKEIRLPKVDEFKERGSLVKRYNPVNVQGIKGMASLRSLLRGIEDINMDNLDETSKRYIEQIFAWKDDVGLKGGIRNLNATNIGFDQNGNVVVLEDKALRNATNGTIYKDMGLAEITKPVRNAVKSLEKMYLDENAEIPNQVAESARDKLSEKAFEFAKRYDGEAGEKVVSKLSELFEALTIEGLKARKPEAIDALNRIQTFVMDNMILQFREENALKLAGKILRKNDDGILNNYYAGKFREGGFVRKGDEEESYKAILLNAKLPTLAAFDKKLFAKTQVAPVVKIYVGESGNLLDVQAGANISQYMKTYGKLANTLNAIARLNEETEDLQKVAKQYANYGKTLGKNSTGYGILGVLKALEEGGGKTKDIRDVIKPQLEEIRDLLLKDPLQAAKKVKEIKEGKVKGLEALGDFLNVAEKTMSRNAKLSVAYFAARSKTAREGIINYYNAEDKKEAFKQFKETLNANEKLNKDAKKSILKNFAKFNALLYKEISILNAGKAAFNQKADELNNGNEKADFPHIENIARNIGRNVVATKMCKSFGVTKEQEVYLSNSWGQGFRGITDGINGKELVKFEKVKVGDHERSVPRLDKAAFNVYLQERRAVVEETKKAIDEEIKASIEESAKRQQSRKRSIVQAASGISADITIEDVVLEDSDVKEAVVEANEESIEKAIESSLDNVDDIPLDEEEDIEHIAKEDETPSVAIDEDAMPFDVSSAFAKARSAKMKM